MCILVNFKQKKLFNCLYKPEDQYVASKKIFTNRQYSKVNISFDSALFCLKYNKGDNREAFAVKKRKKRIFYLKFHCTYLIF